MEILMTTNGQMGVSALDTTGNFSSKFSSLSSSSLPIFSIVPHRPILGVALAGKKSNPGRIFSVRATVNSGGRFTEKQLEFQPTFDEYLKAMESVRSATDSKLIQDLNGEEERSGKLGLASNNQKSWRRTSKLGFKEKLRVESNLEENVSLSVEKRRGGDGDKKSSDGFGEVEEKIFKSKFDHVNSCFEEGGPGQKRNYAAKTLQVKARVSNVESKTNLNMKRSSRPDFERKPGQFESNPKGLSKSYIDLKLGESERRTDSSFMKLISRNDAERKTENPETSRRTQRERSYQSESNLKPTGDAYLTDKLEPSSTSTRTRLDGDQTYTNDAGSEISERSGKFTRAGSDISERNGKFTKDGSEVSERNRMYIRAGSEILERNGKYNRVETEVSERTGMYIRAGSEIPERNGKYTRAGTEISERNRKLTRAGSHILERNGKFTKSEIEISEIYGKYTSAGNEISGRSGSFTRGRKLVKENVDNDLDMERAAFRSFQVFTDIRGEPRVTRMEMEMRIEHLAKWLNGTNIDLPEWMFSKMMHGAKIRFSDHSILRVIQILGKLGNWRRVLQVIEWLQSRERFKSYKSRFIYTAALDALGKAKRPVEALNVFYGMQKEFSSYPDLAAYHCIAVTLGQAGHMKELFDVIDCMRSPPQKKFKTGMLEKWDPRLEPDVVVYNAVLNACAHRKQWEGAFWVLQQLKEQGVHPSSTTYGLVMEVLFACGKYNLVHEFFIKVEKSTIPSSLNYKVLVNTLWREGKPDEAVLAVQDMETRGIVGSASLYYDLARCLCSAGRCEEALMQIDKICKVANKPLVVTYTGLIQACLDMGNVKNGVYIFKQMCKFCSPNLVTCNIMLKAYLEHKMFENAKDLFQEMLDNSDNISSRNDYKTTVVPDNYTFNIMLNACFVDQKWDDLKYVYQHMVHRGYNFNVKRHLQMVLEACRAGKGDLLEITWKHLGRAGRVPPPSIVKERFCMKLEEGDYATAISCITSQPTTELHVAFSEKGWLHLFNANINRFQKDTLFKLIQELSNLIAGSALPHPIVKNLLISCRQFTRTNMALLQINTKSQT